MCEFAGKSNERTLCKLSKSEILRLYSIVHVAMETTKTSHFTCQSKSFINVFFTCQVSAFELQPFSCHDLANNIYKLPKLCSATLRKWRSSSNDKIMSLRMNGGKVLCLPPLLWYKWECFLTRLNLFLNGNCILDSGKVIIIIIITT